MAWHTGSGWIRIDPHIHTPGTLRNNQFGDDWNEYLQRLQGASPAALVLGVTDYFVLSGYKRVVEKWKAGALPAVKLIFPNIELRLNIKTDKGSAVNVHLLASPSHADHVGIIEEKLRSLTFRYGNEDFRCSEAEIARLGRAHAKRNDIPDHTAQSEGAKQFKVEFSQLVGLRDDSWIRDHVLFAVAAGADGLGGISKDSGFHAQREQLGAFADIIFSGQAADRRFWSGDHPDFITRGYVPKPCLHGCDAHTLDEVLRPPLERRCWIRAEPTFEGLRQTLVEPERRVHIGKEPPERPSPALTIRSLRITGAADWLPQSAFEMNDGLVSVIGARGSGKTALLDLIALATGAAEAQPGSASFIARAADHLHGVTAEVEWGDGTVTRHAADAPWVEGEAEPRARYLSQRFVEDLCSGDSMARPLVAEVERVVFEAIPEEDRQSARSFGELRSLHLQGTAASLVSARREVRERTREIGRELEIKGTLPRLKGEHAETQRLLKGAEQEFAKLPSGTDAEKRGQMDGAVLELQKLKEEVGKLERLGNELGTLASDVKEMLRSGERAHATLRQRYASHLTELQWELVRPRIADAGATMLEDQRVDVAGRAASARAHGLTWSSSPEEARPESRGIAFVTSEIARLTKELGLDPESSRRRTELSKRIAVLKANEATQKGQVEHAEKADERISTANGHRLNAYAEVFDSMTHEVRALESLYAPLRESMDAEKAFSKLTFEVRRVVNLSGWCADGEAMLDLRKDTAFQGRGGLERLARTHLLKAWESGDSTAVRAAMVAFLPHAPKRTDLAAGASTDAVGDWLFSTDHIEVQYRIRYEQTDLHRLSPGTRGIVLLTLYLGLDQWDQRPLLIDQPEENLDPASVQTDLVGFFRAATRRRQVIMVTHNANLVVNTDSDQVVVAQGERIDTHALPRIQYRAGGLEDRGIREAVCALLEGGEEAFRRRGRRYGIRA